LYGSKRVEEARGLVLGGLGISYKPVGAPPAILGGL
jgi:hypothetical protein